MSFPNRRRAAPRKKTYPNALAYLWGEWIRPIGEALVIALIVTTFVVTTVLIDGDSDRPTLRDGERVVVPKYETWLHRFGIGAFQRGDFAVLKPPVGAPQSERPMPLLGAFGLRYRPYFIKRIVGVGGDTVRMENGQLFVNGERIDESPVLEYWEAQQSLDTEGFGNTSNWPMHSGEAEPPDEITVPAGHVFVIGDNRSPGGSEDSRVFGPVPLENVAGRATFVMWPPVARGPDGSMRLNLRTLPRPDAYDAIMPPETAAP